MRLLSYLSLLELIDTASCLQFTNPPPAGNVGDYSFNAVVSIGSNIDIQWTLGSGDISPMSLTLFQDVPGEAFEYIFRMLSLSCSTYSPLGYLTNLSKKTQTLILHPSHGLWTRSRTFHNHTLSNSRCSPRDRQGHPPTAITLTSRQQMYFLVLLPQ
jgi:hypothetical protein